VRGAPQDGDDRQRRERRRGDAGRPAEAINATAPTPSASVEMPTTTVSRPQTMKRTPRKSTWDFINC
jgi:hypothetical protein